MSQKKNRLIRKYLENKNLKGKGYLTDCIVVDKKNPVEGNRVKYRNVKVIHSIPKEVKNAYKKSNWMQKTILGISLKAE